MKNKKNVFLIIISLFFTYSCQTNKNIILFENDYNIINYLETIYNDNEKSKTLEIEIKNSEKIIQLNNVFNPKIILYYNNKKYIIRGSLVYQSHRPINFARDYYWFSMDENKKIYDFQNNVLKLIGFERI